MIKGSLLTHLELVTNKSTKINEMDLLIVYETNVQKVWDTWIWGYPQIPNVQQVWLLIYADWQYLLVCGDSPTFQNHLTPSPLTKTGPEVR